MKDADALTRKLFENETLLLPPADREFYMLRSKLENTNAQLVIISFAESNPVNSNGLVAEAEIFKRMLSRLPQPDTTTEIIYTTLTSLQLNKLPPMIGTEQLLLCGVELKNNNETIALNRNINRDQMQILVVPRITEIDADASLKKAMWTEWMKQFQK